MGSFEKLGILVIVVIIVMILAVAVFQWGATGPDGAAGVLPIAEGGDPGPLVVDYVNRTRRETASEGRSGSAGAPAAAKTWPGGIPKRYGIKKDDKVWVLVVRRWKLREAFIQAIRAANPGVELTRIRPGDEIAIPDPARYRRGSKSKSSATKNPPVRTRTYEIKEGDLLQTIARDHLGDRGRWPEIVKLNPGLDPARLKLGRKIRLPAK